MQAEAWLRACPFARALGPFATRRDGRAMDGAKWLSCANQAPLLKFLFGKASARKLRLFACACCRRIWHSLPHAANRDLVAAFEDYPEGSGDEPVLNEALLASS